MHVYYVNVRACVQFEVNDINKVTALGLELMPMAA